MHRCERLGITSAQSIAENRIEKNGIKSASAVVVVISRATRRDREPVIRDRERMGDESENLTV